MVFFHIDLGLPFVFFVFHVVCRRLVVSCFVIDLLQLIVVLPTVNFFVVFTLTVQMTNFDPID